MRQMFREFRRAPARIVTSILALAFALGAMGVFAIPTVASSSLRDSVAADRMANIAFDTTDSDAIDIAAAAESVPGVDDALAEVVVDVGTGPASPGAALLPVVGRDLTDTRIDVVSATSGRLPTVAGEVLVTAGAANLGDTITATAPDGREVPLTVVGVGGTTFWAGETVAFSTFATAADLAGTVGANHLVVRATDASGDGLRSAADAVRERLAPAGVTLTDLPVTVPDGTHPIENDIRQVSTLIGFLGIVAGLVALVLLGSTTNTLITERTREAAVMRALGARNRPLRRRLRRLAVAIAAAALVIGLPLGVLISNVIARMVMQEFLDITPGIAVSVPVLVISAVFALVGAALVASGAARRVTKIPLATALRDRDGSPFGRRFAERARRPNPDRWPPRSHRAPQRCPSPVSFRCHRRPGDRRGRCPADHRVARDDRECLQRIRVRAVVVELTHHGVGHRSRHRRRHAQRTRRFRSERRAGDRDDR